MLIDLLTGLLFGYAALGFLASLYWLDRWYEKREAKRAEDVAAAKRLAETQARESAAVEDLILSCRGVPPRITQEKGRAA